MCRSVRSGDPLAAGALTLGLRLGEVAQITGDDAPADVTFQPHGAMRPHTGKAVVAPQTMDATLNACPPAIPAPPARIMFPRPLLCRRRAGAGDDDMAHPQRLRVGFDALDVEATIPREQTRRSAKDRAVVADGGQY